MPVLARAQHALLGLIRLMRRNQVARVAMQGFTPRQLRKLLAVLKAVRRDIFRQRERVHVRAAPLVQMLHQSVCRLAPLALLAWPLRFLNWIGKLHFMCCGDIRELHWKYFVWKLCHLFIRKVFSFWLIFVYDLRRGEISANSRSGELFVLLPRKAFE